MSSQTLASKRIVAGERFASKARVRAMNEKAFDAWLADRNGFAGASTTFEPIVVRAFGEQS